MTCHARFKSGANKCPVACQTSSMRMQGGTLSLRFSLDFSVPPVWCFLLPDFTLRTISNVSLLHREKRVWLCFACVEAGFVCIDSPHLDHSASAVRFFCSQRERAKMDRDHGNAWKCDRNAQIAPRPGYCCREFSLVMVWASCCTSPTLEAPTNKLTLLGPLLPDLEVQKKAH